MKQSKFILKQTQKLSKLEYIKEELSYWIQHIFYVGFMKPLRWFKYHFIPQHKYHILDLTKSGNHYTYGWYDTDTRMLHACFLLLVEYVEKEKPFEVADWNSDAKTEHVGQEIKDLYDWWKIRRDAAHEQLRNDWANCEDRPSFVPVEGGGFRIETPDSLKILNERSDELDREDQRNLERLIKIRHWLWT